MQHLDHKTSFSTSFCLKNLTRQRMKSQQQLKRDV